MIESRVIEDYTYLWYDVRPHPNFGTVEIRVADAQTRLEHTLALAALIQAMVKEIGEHFEAGKRLARYPHEMIDENKWLAARHGLDGNLVDLPKKERVPTARAGAAGARPRPRARAGPGLGRRARGDRGHPRARQWGDAPDRRLRGEQRPARGHGRDRREDGSVGRRGRLKPAPARLRRPGILECGERAGPFRRLQELQLRGLPVRDGVSLLRAAGPQAGAEDRARASRPSRKAPRRQRTSLPRLRRGEIPGIAAETRPYGTFALIADRAGDDGRLRRRRAARSIDWTALSGRSTASTGSSSPPPFQHLDHFGYAFIALTAVGVFGTLLERRFGLVFVVATFLLAGAGGRGLALVLEATPALGANGAALGLLCAWLVDDWLAAPPRRRPRERPARRLRLRRRAAAAVGGRAGREHRRGASAAPRRAPCWARSPRRSGRSVAVRLRSPPRARCPAVVSPLMA